MTHASPGKVLIGLSGGLSSAVAAALLKSEGYEVHAVHFKKASRGLCHADRPEDAVRAIAQILDLPLQTVDVSEEYEERVVDAYVHEVVEGSRPIPCVTCHAGIVIPGLERVAEARGFTAIATGHFSVVGRDAATGLGRLYRASETLPDQSFWLYGTSARTLSRLLTPMGGLSAPMIEKLAAQFDLPVTAGAVQGNLGPCFAGEPEKAAALFEARVTKELRPKGTVRTLAGGIGGDHLGLHRYVPGQKFAGPGGSGPEQFVESLNPQAHVLVIAAEKALEKREILARAATWIRPVHGLKGLKAELRLVPGGDPIECTVTIFEAGRIRVRFASPVRAPIPGRPVVFYEENEVLGGAIIDRLIE